MNQYYIGLMSGTSMDAIDAAVVELSGPRPELIQCHSHPIPDSIRTSLKRCYEQRNPTLKQLAIMDKQMGEQFAQAAYSVLEQSALHASQIRAIGSHGQTIFHLPTGEHPNTIQIGDPNTIAEHTGITTIADFRRRDMAAGGQGAPLVPAFHASLFRSQEHSRVILNIGGIANITILPSAPTLPVTGFDTGPGNGLMDAWIHTHQKQSMDESGHWAASGKVHALLLEKLIKDSFFEQAPPKSTGREYFNLAWLQTHIKRCPKRILHKDVQATLCELTARTIAEAILQYAPETSEILVCGGGAHNLSLMFRIQHLLAHCKVRSTEDHGLAPDWVEAAAFAWLAKQTLEGRPGNLPEVTGATHPVVLGGIYKGSY